MSYSDPGSNDVPPVVPKASIVLLALIYNILTAFIALTKDSSPNGAFLLPFFAVLYVAPSAGLVYLVGSSKGRRRVFGLWLGRAQFEAFLGVLAVVHLAGVISLLVIVTRGGRCCCFQYGAGRIAACNNGEAMCIEAGGAVFPGRQGDACRWGELVCTDGKGGTYTSFPWITTVCAVLMMFAAWLARSAPEVMDESEEGEDGDGAQVAGDGLPAYSLIHDSDPTLVA